MTDQPDGLTDSKSEEAIDDGPAGDPQPDADHSKAAAPETGDAEVAPGAAETAPAAATEEHGPEGHATHRRTLDSAEAEAVVAAVEALEHGAEAAGETPAFEAPAEEPQAAAEPAAASEGRAKEGEPGGARTETSAGKGDRHRRERGVMERAIAGTVSRAPARPSSAASEVLAGAVRRGEPTTVNVTQGGIAEVEADTVNVTQGGIGAVSAEDVTVRLGGIGQAQGEDISVRLGAVGVARGERVSVELGSAGMVIASNASVTQGYARAVLARDVRFRQGGAQTVLASNVTFERQSGAFIVLARRVNGDVRTVLDWRGALALGAMFALVAGIFGRRRKR